MRNLKRFCSLLLAFCMILSMSAVASAAEVETYSGTVGDSAINWSLDTYTGRLIISGSGDTDVFQSRDDQPWAAVRDQIKEVWFSSMGALTISDLAYWFTDCTALTRAEIPYTTHTVGTKAFAGCSALKELLFYYEDGDHFHIVEGAFSNQTEVDTTVYFPGEQSEVMQILIGYDWERDNRGNLEFRDVYTTSLLATKVYNSGYFATYYCNYCGRSLFITHDLQDNGSGRFHVRYWACGNSSCDRYYYGDARDENGVLLGTWQYMLQDDHVFDSTGTCTYCGYYDSSQASCSHGRYYYAYDYYSGTYHYCTVYCYYCDEEIDYYRETHYLSEDYTYYNATYHDYESYCSDCDTVVDSAREAHNWSYSYSNYSTTQHKISMSCSVCGYSTTSYASHADSNGDGYCDDCRTSMKVTVTWNAGTNGGTVNGSSSVTTSVTSGSVATPPSYTPVKTGHTFKGWYTASSGGSLYSSVSVTAARTFYAQFNAANYTIRWDHGNGDTTSTSQTYGASLVLPADPIRAGYTFKGWYTASSGGSKVTGSTVYSTAAATTYYAQWTANSYTVTWDKGDGTSTTTAQTYGEKMTLPSAPARTGYTFGGWYTAKSGDTQITASTTYTSASNMTYYARWVGNSYAITWDLGGGATETTSQIYGNALALPAVTPAKAGHDFIGWYTAASGGTKVDANTIYNTASATTYYARFTPAKYTIIWDLGDGQTATTSQTYGEKLVLPDMPIRDSYTFDGWFTAESGGIQVDNTVIYTATGPSIYYAQWSLIEVFSVTVPVVLPMAISEDGVIYTAADLNILNASTDDVKVTGLTVETVSGWSLVPFSTNMAQEKVDSKLVGFYINGAETRDSTSSQSLSLTGDWTIQKDSALALSYDAVISAMSEAVTDQAILSVVFVLQWA